MLGSALKISTQNVLYIFSEIPLHSVECSVREEKPILKQNAKIFKADSKDKQKKLDHVQFSEKRQLTVGIC